MAGGGKVRIADRDNFGELARVVNGRLLVSSVGGGGGGSVDITSVGGVPIGPTVPVSGTITVSSITAPVTIVDPVVVNQGTSPWVVSGTIAVGGTVAVTQSTSPWVVGGTVAVSNFPATQPVSGTVTALQGTSPWVVSGTIAVGGTVAVTQSTSPWVVSGTVTIGSQPIQVVSLDHAVFLNQGKIEDRNGTIGVPGTMVAVRGQGDALDTGDRLEGGLMITLPSTQLPQIATGLFTKDNGAEPLYTDPEGNLSVASFIVGRATSARRVADVVAETEAFDTGPYGSSVTRGLLMAGVCRADPPNDESPATDGLFAFPRLDLNRRLWVRQAGDIMTTLPLSASTRGRPIQITATASTGTTLHVATTTAGTIDRLYIFLSNTSTASVIVTIEFGTTGGGFEKDYVVPANDTILAVDGEVIGGAATDTITAFATTGSVINATGRVERLTA